MREGDREWQEAVMTKEQEGPRKPMMCHLDRDFTCVHRCQNVYKLFHMCAQMSKCIQILPQAKIGAHLQWAPLLMGGALTLI
jgi:hypothetical protein